jgi:prepilin-type N-terminal cleavage/methylation domain-containing protein
MTKFKFQKSGFTLIEVIISIAIVVIALISALSLITFSTTSIRINKSKIIAAGLVQEGLEIVKNIRDNNWLHNCPACDRRTTGTWRTGLNAGDSRVQYNLENLLSFSSVPLKIDSNGFYQYDSGSNTSFYRRINIYYIPGNDDQIKVIAEVTWTEKGGIQSVSAETRYYNWLKE